MWNLFRRKTPTSQLIQASTLTGGRPDSFIGIERVDGKYHKGWDRFLTFKGSRAYHVGNICNTCAFFFRRVEGANSSLPLEELVAALDTGIPNLSGPVPALILTQLPPATYEVLLLRIRPHLVSPGSTDDYFSKERRALWRDHRPHDPQTEYYRLGSRPLGAGTQLFEFLVPMYPHVKLGESVQRHRRELRSGATPTAIAMAFLDVKHPGTWTGDPEITKHSCLAHYLLDGHHKTYAAALSGRPITLLAFLHTAEGMATADDRARVIAALNEGLPSESNDLFARLPYRARRADRLCAELAS
jgi:hypothetical protein